MKNQSYLSIFAIVGILGISSQQTLALEVVHVYGQQYNFIEDWSYGQFTWENEWGDTFERDLAYQDYLEQKQQEMCWELELEKPSGCYSKPNSIAQTVDGYWSVKYVFLTQGHREVLNDALIAAAEEYAESRSNYDAANTYWIKATEICQAEYSSIMDVTSCLIGGYYGAAGLENTWSLSMPVSFGPGSFTAELPALSYWGPAFLDLIDSTMACMAWHNLMEREDC